MSKTNINKLQKPIIVSGVVLGVLTILASIVSLSVASSLYHSPLGVVYYLRFAVVLLGGGLIGSAAAILANKYIKKQSSVVTTGIIFALLSYCLFMLTDVFRVLFNPAINELGFPLTAIIFNGMPLLALALTTVVAAAAYAGKRAFTLDQRWLQGTFASIFILQQLSLALSLTQGLEYAQLDTMTFFLLALNILITPLIVSGLVYLSLKGTLETGIRIFMATLIGAVYLVIRDIGWEFRLDASYESTLIFSFVITIVAIIAVAVLTYSVRRIAQSR